MLYAFERALLVKYAHHMWSLHILRFKVMQGLKLHVGITVMDRATRNCWSLQELDEKLV